MAFDYNDINDVKRVYQLKLEELKTIEGNYIKLGYEVASTEALYMKAEQEAIAKLKIDGESVTLIPKLAKGRITDQFYALKVAEVNFNAYRANIKRLYSNIDFLRSLLSAAKSQMDIR